MKYKKIHVPEVKKLFDKYLVPVYLKRMGINKNQVTSEVIQLEELLHPDIVSHERYLESSVVCIDENSSNEVVGFGMGLYLNKNLYRRCFDQLEEYLKVENRPEDLRSYAKSILQLHRYRRTDLFDKYGLKTVLMFESSVVIPNLIGKGIGLNIAESLACKFGRNVDGIIFETQMPIAKYKALEIKDRKYISICKEEILFNEIYHNGFHTKLKLARF